MTSIITWFAGKKTYFMALALLAYAAGGYFTGHMTSTEALGLLWSSGTLASLRAAIAKVNTPQ